MIEMILAEITIPELPALTFIFHGKQGSYLNVFEKCSNSPHGE
jgi:hypothetical protein